MKNNKTLAVLAIVGACVLGVGLIVGVIGTMLGGLFMFRKETLIESTETGEVWDSGYSVSERFDDSISSVTLQLGGTDVRFVAAETAGYDVRHYEDDRLDIKFSDGELSMIDRHSSQITNSGWDRQRDSEVIIYLTSDQLESLSIDLGAGQFEANDLKIGKLIFTLGAGQANMRGATIDRATFSSGAGEVDLKRCTITDLNVSAGAGSLDFSGYLKGNCTFEGGVGSIDLDLYDGSENYYFDCSHGVGEIKVGDVRHGGLGGEFVVGDISAPCHITISSGVGEVDVSFNESGD